MAVTRSSSALSLSNTAQTWNQNIDIPTDAELTAVTASGWRNTIGFMGTTPITIGGSTVTYVASTDDQNANDQVFLGYLYPTPTGTQNFSVNWAGTPTTGVRYCVAFYKGVDSGSPIKSNGIQETNGTDLTGLTASAGDMMFGGMGSDSSPTITDNGQTELVNDVTNTCYLGAAENSGATGFYFTGGTFTSVAAMVIQASTGGASASLVMQDVSGSQTIGNIDLVQHNTLSVNNIAQSQTIDGNLVLYPRIYFVAVQASEWNVATQSPVVDIPTDVQDGDLVFIFIVAGDNTNVTPPTGWEQAGSEVDV